MWNFASAAAVFDWGLSDFYNKKPKETTVSHGKTLAAETYSDGSVRYAVVTQVYWVVKNPAQCCGAAGGHSVIQFVRHLYHLNGSPAKEGEDTWTLDILDTEAARGARGQPLRPDLHTEPAHHP